MANVTWKSAPIYPMARATEFALAAIARFPTTGEKIVEYVLECEHSADDHFEGGLVTLESALEDFGLYLEN